MSEIFFTVLVNIQLYFVYKFNFLQSADFCSIWTVGQLPPKLFEAWRKECCVVHTYNYTWFDAFCIDWSRQASEVMMVLQASLAYNLQLPRSLAPRRDWAALLPEYLKHSSPKTAVWRDLGGRTLRKKTRRQPTSTLNSGLTCANEYAMNIAASVFRNFSRYEQGKTGWIGDTIPELGSVVTDRI